MRRPSIGLGQAALLAASLAICLLGAEIALRLAEPDRSPPPGARQISAIRDLNRPNVRGVFRGVPHHTNRHGMRDREYAIPKPPGIARIAILGDSFTMGSGVLEEETYAAIVEAKLGPRVEVLNLGVAGFSLAASVARLERIGLAFDPDLLVYGWTINDVQGEHYRKLRETPAPDRAPAGSRLWRLVAKRWTALREDPRTSYLRELEHNHFENPPAWRAFTSELARLRTIADARGVCAVVLLHPFLFELGDSHPYTPIYEAVEQAARSAGLYVVRTFPYFAGRRPSSLWVTPDDSHPNAKGHRLLAEALLEGIARLPRRCLEALESTRPGVVTKGSPPGRD